MKTLALLVLAISVALGGAYGNDRVRPPGWIPIPPGTQSNGKDQVKPANDSGSREPLSLPYPIFETKPVTASDTPKEGKPARFIVTVPSDDTVLYIDGKKTQKTGTLRTFSQSGLIEGKNYSMDFVIKFWRNGVPYDYTVKVNYTAGMESTVDMTGFSKYMQSSEPMKLYQGDIPMSMIPSGYFYGASQSCGPGG